MKVLLPFSLIAALFLGACASQEVIKVVSVAGGGTERIVMGMGGPKPADDDKITVELSNVLPIQQTRQFSHTFIIRPKIKTPITRVQVWEITEDPAYLVMDEKEPKMTQDGYWTGFSASITAKDPSLAWVNHQSVTMLVYRIKVTFADGSSSTVPSACIVTFPVKAMIKQQLGL